MRSRLPAAVRAAGVWLRRFARTTPGLIGALIVVLTVLCVAAGLTAGRQFDAKIERGDRALAQTEPLAFAAQRLFVALSTADASAAAAFLSGGIESTEVRGRYEQALAEAAVSLADATAGAGDEQTRAVVARIAADLPTYTGLVETARANNRQGHPVGSAYLRQASELMQTSLLPRAQELEDARTDAVRADQDAIGAVPYTTVVLLVLVLAVCAGGSVLLTRRTNRRVNVGVAVAGCATVLALLWGLGATLAAGQLLDRGAGGAGARADDLAQARILAQRARTDEMLGLITRGDITGSEDAYRTHTGDLRGRLTAAGIGHSEAERALVSWESGHRTQLAAYESADYTRAVAQAIGGGPDGSERSFDRLDTALRTELAQARTDLRDGVYAARTVLIPSPYALPLLLLGAAAVAVGGLWPRLKEFL
ncbi:hypothetical protein [Nocardia thailandica]|uniref:hypothetical protein n=1 Tax=Nocardia thailandica TaxID=257275 RepID=UPI001FE1C1CC|nr:hypothetical protein [Nocardia thailandica]